jgi:Family of unknown function (DUF6286)
VSPTKTPDSIRSSTPGARIDSPAPGAPVIAKARTPLGPGRITLVGVLLSVTTIAVGFIGIRDALISANVMTGRSWLERGVDSLNGLTPQWWCVPVGVLMVLLGLWLLLVAVRPRPRTAIRLRSQTGVFMRPRDVKKLAERAADDIDGVISTKISASRRLARMNVNVTGNDTRIGETVREAVAERLAALDAPPRLKIKMRAGVAP